MFLGPFLLYFVGQELFLFISYTLCDFFLSPRWYLYVLGTTLLTIETTPVAVRTILPMRPRTPVTESLGLGG
jgi:hypothetical protein